VSLDLPDVSSTFADLALFWTKFADMNVYCDRLDQFDRAARRQDPSRRPTVCRSPT